MNYGMALQVALVKAQLTHKELSAKSGVNVTTISLVSRNKTKPHPKTLGKIITALNLSYDDFMALGE